MRIAASAGHNVYIGSNFDCGSVGSGLREADITKETVRLLIPMLQKLGHTVLDVTPYNQRFGHSKEAHQVRCKKADDFKADIYLDIHVNAGGGTGVECWTYSPSGKSVPYARKICDNISALGLRNRGVKSNKNYWSLSLGRTPSIIIEGAFIDSVEDMNKLTPLKYATSIAEGLTGKKVVQDEVKSPVSNDKLYRVQTGAFKDKRNAEKLVQELKSKGYNAFIV